MTGERADGPLSRYGVEEYISNHVISLDHRVVDLRPRLLNQIYDNFEIDLE